MSIATEIQRLAQAKADIKAAIEEKGVEVGDGTIDTFASKISEITGGGGSGGIPTGYKTVTFMNGDNVLFERLVLSGDDCPDPLTQGRIETPTKESTVQYHYTYKGWSEALTNITEDKVIYATYTETVRTYTVTFYDEDGTTVLHTEQVAYGTIPSYTPEKSGFSFVGWQPAITNVTGNTSYSAMWEEKTTFAGGSWEDIIKIAESGQAEEYFAVGDTKTITASDGTSLKLHIIGFNHDDLADGTGKASMTILSEKSLPDTMDVSNWETLSTNMKTILKPKLPEVLQSAIKSVTKLCDSGTTSAKTTVPITFELFPLSMEEMKIRRHSSVWQGSETWNARFIDLGTPYALFENIYSTSNGGPNFLQPYAGAATDKCWLRQSYFFDKIYGCSVEGGASGSNKWFVKITEANTVKKVVQLAFCI